MSSMVDHRLVSLPVDVCQLADWLRCCCGDGQSESMTVWIGSVDRWRSGASSDAINTTDPMDGIWLAVDGLAIVTSKAAAKRLLSGP